MIIQIRGTSGSGKTTVMRKVMEHFPLVPVYRDGRKQPLYYKSDDHNLSVLGHYESPCGGCDTIGSARQIFDWIQTLCLFKYTLCEGLLLSEDVKWTTQLRHDEVQVIFLTTSLEQCLANIRKRRDAAGNSKELNVKNTTNRVAVIERARIKLLDAGIMCRRASSEQAVKLILNLVKD